MFSEVADPKMVEDARRQPSSSVPKDRENKFFSRETLEITMLPFDARISCSDNVKKQARLFWKAEHPNFSDWHFLILSDHFESVL